MVHNLSDLTIYWDLSSKKEKLKKKKFELKSGKKIIIKLLQVGQWLDLFNKAHCPIQHNFQLFYYFLLQYYFFSPNILLLIFNYFFLFSLNHTRLLSSRFLHFILLNFITSSPTLLHLHFTFLIVRNFCVFY